MKLTLYICYGMALLMIFTVACVCMTSCTHKDDEMADLGEMVLKKHEGLRIDFTPEDVK